MAKKPIYWELQHRRGRNEWNKRYNNKIHCAFTPICCWHGVCWRANIAKLLRLIMCEQCDSNIALIPGLPCFFSSVCVHIIHASGRVTLLCTTLNTNQITKSEKPGMAVGILVAFTNCFLLSAAFWSLLTIMFSMQWHGTSKSGWSISCKVYCHLVLALLFSVIIPMGRQLSFLTSLVCLF